MTSALPRKLVAVAAAVVGLVLASGTVHANAAPVAKAKAKVVKVAPTTAPVASADDWWW